MKCLAMNRIEPTIDQVALTGILLTSTNLDLAISVVAGDISLFLSFHRVS